MGVYINFEDLEAILILNEYEENDDLNEILAELESEDE